MSDEKTAERPGGKFDIEELIRRTSERREEAEATPAKAEPDELPTLDKLAPLPAPGDPYKAFARPANKMVPTLHLLLGDGRRCGFPYAGLVEGPHLLPGDDPGKGGVIVLRFSASVIVEVTIAGRRLDELHNYLGDHRVAWVRELPKGKVVRDDGSSVVARIEIGQAEGWPPPGME